MTNPSPLSPDILDRMLSCVSPSSVGEYAICPYRLVCDATNPKVRDDKYRPEADFGTVCHYLTQRKLGCAPPDPPKDETIEWAKKVREAPKTAAAFEEHCWRCADMAAQVLDGASPLPVGLHWVSEVKAYDKDLLPSRKGRKGETKGFGGSIDLLRSDGDILWDLKFVGLHKVPTPEMARGAFVPGKGKSIGHGGLKMEYLYQLASYRIAKRAKKTGIIWTSRCARGSAWALIDWELPRSQLLERQVRRFIDFTGYANFASLAWPVRGDNCDYCQHKGTCPAWVVEGANDGAYCIATQRADAWGDIPGVTNGDAAAGLVGAF
jgi:hypothetical protein